MDDSKLSYRIDKARHNPSKGCIEVFRYDDTGSLYKCGHCLDGQLDGDYRAFWWFFIDGGGPEWSRLVERADAERREYYEPWRKFESLSI